MINYVLVLYWGIPDYYQNLQTPASRNKGNYANNSHIVMQATSKWEAQVPTLPLWTVQCFHQISLLPRLSGSPLYNRHSYRRRVYTIRGTPQHL